MIASFALVAAANYDVAAIGFLCLVLTLALFYYTFHLPERLEDAPEKTRLMYLRERKETIYDNLRDLNFEYKAGKFPEADYQQMCGALEDEAATVLAEIEVLEKTSNTSVNGSAPKPKGARA